MQSNPYEPPAECNAPSTASPARNFSTWYGLYHYGAGLLVVGMLLSSGGWWHEGLFRYVDLFGVAACLVGLPLTIAGFIGRIVECFLEGLHGNGS